MKKLIIIGKGPAGVSAGLYAKRGGVDTVIVGKDSGALLKAEKIENYYGFDEPISGKELSERGIKNAKRLGIEFIDAEVTDIGFGEKGGFFVQTAGERLEASAVVIAVGAARISVNIPNLKELEGHGVSYCATCDAFFYRKKRVAVIGAGEFAFHEAEALKPHASEVFLLTNGENPQNVPEGIEVISEPIERILGEKKVSSAAFKGREDLNIDGLFVAIGVAGATSLAKKLGILTEGNYIKIDAEAKTNIPGIFAAGDATGGLLQIAKAVHEGAAAGLSTVKFLREN